LLAFAALAALGAACGGGGASGARAESGDDVSDEEANASGGDEAADDDDAESESSDEGAPLRARCTDATCFECGEGLCPSGFYCDVKAGPACSWLPECAREPSCGCITRVLGDGCACEDKGGGPHVTCS
jgi:hypothetical protein